MRNDVEFERAFFVPQTGNGERIEVHFNPNSLQYTITNTLRNQGRGNNRRQYVSQSTGKLTMDLIFDTTHDGQDVRVHTEKIARFMEPETENDNKIPAIVEFRWGTYQFQGMVESYRESIDFFAPTGVPLRASINLTLAKQDEVFEPSDTSSTFDTQRSLESVEVPNSSGENDENGAGQDAASTATRAGDPRAGRDIAAANDQESMRFASGPSLTVSPSDGLSGPVAFATGGAGVDLGIGGGAGVEGGISAGVEIGISGGAGMTAGAGAGISVSGGAGLAGGAGITASGSVSGELSVGGSASAGVSATAGAFAGLRTQASAQRRFSALDPNRLIRHNESASLASDSSAIFRVGGQATIEGSSSLRADVGISVSLASRIQFEE